MKVQHFLPTLVVTVLRANIILVMLLPAIHLHFWVNCPETILWNVNR